MNKNKTFMSCPPIIVTAKWLKEAILANDKNLVILDTTWIARHPSRPKTTGIEAYESKHIPGAQHFDMDQGVMKTKLIPRNLPDPVIFQEYVRSLGISAHSHVIVYDRDDGASVSTTTGGRSCYTFKLYGHVKVSLLSGGLVHWEAEGYTTEVGPTPSPMAGDFVVNFRKEMVVKFDEMCEIEAAGNIQIVDTRRPIHFSGENPEPSIISQVVLTDGKFPLPKETEMVRGHMKNALNLYFKDFYDDEDQVSLKSIDALRKTFDDAGVDLNCPAITTCYIGHTAALCYVVAYFCGQHNYRVYYGSWTEYGQRTV